MGINNGKGFCSMFRDKMTDQQAKYALRKKKNGGGAASFLIGTVVVGA